MGIARTAGRRTVKKLLATNQEEGKKEKKTLIRRMYDAEWT